MYQLVLPSHSCTLVSQFKISYKRLRWMTASLTVCLTGTHTCTQKHIHAIKSLTKVLQSWSLCDCTLYRRASSISLCMPRHYGMALHYPRMTKTTINTASVMETSNNEKEIKSETLDLSPARAAPSYLAEGELIVKAAARYTEFIWRRCPADLPWPVRLCPWLKGKFHVGGFWYRLFEAAP